MTATGRCLCGGVTFEVEGALRDVIDCHCVRCRRHTGHFMAATAVAVDDLVITGDTLRWYAATDSVAYGFCGHCGSTLFWRAADKPESISVAAGTLDPPTGLRTVAALFTADASDYQRLDDTIDHHDYDH